MSTNRITPELDALARTLARETVQELSPEDVQVFDDILKLQSEQSLRGSGTTLGTGIELMAGSFLVAIYPFFEELLKRLLDIGFEVLKEVGKKYASGLRFERSSGGGVLSKDQIQTMLSELQSLATARNLNAEQTTALENVLLRTLVLK